MDHRISKDMISSGMIPSGEKKKEDLSRTQYGSAPSPSKLMDAYKSMYGNKEEVINEHHKKDADGNTIPHEGEEIKEENLDEINAGYSTDPGLAKTKNAQVNTTTRQGKPRSKAQMMAARRIASGKSITDVKAANTAAMRAGAAARNQKFQQDKGRVLAPTQGKPMPSNPQLKSQPQTSTSSNMSGSNRRAMMSKRRRGLMNDLDLFDLIKGAFIEEGYTESDALAFMVEASPEYLAELDRELTMLGAGLASIPAIAATAKKIFKPKVDKTIDTKRKTLNIGGDKRSGVGMKEAAGVFADPKLNKKYPDQPKMTEKGKKILPNLPDPEGMGSTKTSKRPFGISKSTNDALKMLK